MNVLFPNVTDVTWAEIDEARNAPGLPVAARLNAFEATHLITADGFLRRGAVVPLKGVADEAVAAPRRSG